MSDIKEYIPCEQIGGDIFNIHLMDEGKVGQHTVQMQTGDKIMLYTDGVLESRNTREDLFGKSRLYDVLKKHRHEPIRKMVDAVYANLNEFRHQTKPDDDISILGVEYCGQT